MKKKVGIIVICVIILVIIAGGFFYFAKDIDLSLSTNKNLTNSSVNPAVPIVDIDRQFATVEIDQEKIKDLVVEQKNEIEAYIESLYAEGTYIAYAEIKNIVEPPEGEYYVGWLVHDNNKVINMGTFEKKGNAYIRLFTSQTDYSEYTSYVITLESDKNAINPSTELIRGKLVTRE